MYDREETLLLTSRIELALAPSVKGREARMTLPFYSRPSSLPNIVGQIFDIPSVADKEPSAALPTH